MKKLHEMGLTSQMAYMGGLVGIGLSILTWAFRDGGKRESAERLAIFIGLWPPTLIQLGRALADQE